MKLSPVPRTGHLLACSSPSCRPPGDTRENLTSAEQARQAPSGQLASSVHATPTPTQAMVEVQILPEHSHTASLPNHRQLQGAGACKQPAHTGTGQRCALRAAHLGIARPAHARILVPHSPPIRCGPIKPAQGQLGMPVHPSVDATSSLVSAVAGLIQQLRWQLQLHLQLPQTCFGRCSRRWLGWELKSLRAQTMELAAHAMAERLSAAGTCSWGR